MPESRPSLTFYGLILYAVFSLTSMAMMSISAATLICCVVFDPQAGGPRALGQEGLAIFAYPRVRVYAACSLALMIAVLASLVSAQWFPLTFGFAAAEVRWLPDLAKLWYFAFPLVLLAAWRRLSPSRQAQVLQAWILCFGVISAIGVVQFFTGFPRAQPNPLLPGYFHPVLFLGHHLSVASIWIFPFFAALELLINRDFRLRVRLPLKFLIPATVCAAFTLIFAYSRTLWFGLPVGLTVWCLLRLPKKIAFSLTALLLVIGAAFSQLPAIQRRLQTTMGVGDRIELWKANWVFFERRPFFGVGFGKNQGLSYDYFRSIHPGQTDFFVGHAHNIYLELLAGTGLAGLLAWLLWISAGLGTLLLASKKSVPLSFAGAALAAWIVFLINGVTQVNFWEGKVLHEVMWMTGLGLLWATAAVARGPEP